LEAVVLQVISAVQAYQLSEKLDEMFNQLCNKLQTNSYRHFVIL